MNQKNTQHPGSGKRQRYIQPSILMSLKLKPSYGYELIQEIQKLGFVEGSAPPGMIYRHLRQLEEEGMVCSEWHTAGTGPAKRIYRLTPEGDDLLYSWIQYMEDQVRKLKYFTEGYYRVAGREDTERSIE